MTINVEDVRPAQRSVPHPVVAPAAPHDPLLQSLSILAGLLERPISAEALRAGLPVLDERLAPEMIVRAAHRAGITAAWRGVIKDIKVNTIGGAIQPGQDLVEIVPLDDTLLVEAKIRPSDVAFLHPGQDAMVKITAYDFAVYGGLKAKVERISADTISEQESGRSQRFFRVMLRTNKNHLGATEHPLPIMPGMTAEVEIMTGHRTVLGYLLKPILDAKNRALTER
jgi:HlyD family type I secretion membrane fusion protein